MWNWGCCTVDYVCILPMCLIKLLPVHFLGLGQSRRAVTPILFSNYFMRYVVAGRLGYMLLPTLLMFFISSIVKKKVFTGTPLFLGCDWYIPSMWVNHRTSPGLPMSVGFVWYLPYLQKYWRPSLDIPAKFFIWWYFLDL